MTLEDLAPNKIMVSKEDEGYSAGENIFNAWDSAGAPSTETRRDNRRHAAATISRLN